MKGYKHFARIYDSADTESFHRRILKIIQSALASSGIHSERKPRLLDLACGTGTFMLSMARAGWGVTGIDISREMLREAAKKFRRYGLSATLHREDMRTYDSPKRFNLVTSLNNSINNLLSPNHLRSTIRNVRLMLAPDGMFIFDVINNRGYRSLWNGNRSVIESDQHFLMIETSYDNETGIGTCKKTGFIKINPKCYQRFDEISTERSYNAAEIRSALRFAGFSKISKIDFCSFPEFIAFPDKYIWIARN